MKSNANKNYIFTVYYQISIVTRPARACSLKFLFLNFSFISYGEPYTFFVTFFFEIIIF